MRTVILLLLLLAPFALAEEYIFDSGLYAAESVDVNIKFNNIVNVGGRASSLETRVYYFPHDFEGQETNSFTSTPNAEDKGEYLLYEWEDVSGDVPLGYETQITSRYWRPAIRRPVNFPYTKLGPELQEYLNSEEIIVITPEISELATEIIGDEDDAVRAIFALGKWVKDNIDYDLNTVTAEAAQTSSWTLENRAGVCDELTSLFIAMLRSQGIPARFISGIAYTNLETLDTFWGPHGWAEVWIEGIGWVPYDVTYGQFGYVDATHIAFRASADAKNNAAEYSMRSRNAQLNPGPLDRQTTLLGKGKELEEELEVEIETALDDVGFGSYNRIDVTVTNPYSFYYSTELFLAKTTQLDTEDFSTSILLGPGESKSIHWIAKVSDTLESGFRYTFPVVVYTNANRSFETDFRATKDGYVAGKKELEVKEIETKKQLEGNFECTYPEEVKLGEDVYVNCEFERQALICIEHCIIASKTNQKIHVDDIGVYTMAATVEDNGRKQQKIVTIKVVDEPKLKLIVEAPEKVNTKDELILKLRVERESFSSPEHAVLTLSHPLFEQSWDLETFDSANNVDVRLFGYQLTSGENEFEIVVKYGDKEERKMIVVTPEPESFGQKLGLWGNSIVAFFSSFG